MKDIIIETINKMIKQEIQNNIKTISDDRIRQLLAQYVAHAEDFEIERIDSGKRHINIRYNRYKVPYLIQVYF